MKYFIFYKRLFVLFPHFVLILLKTRQHWVYGVTSFMFSESDSFVSKRDNKVFIRWCHESDSLISKRDNRDYIWWCHQSDFLISKRDNREYMWVMSFNNIKTSFGEAFVYNFFFCKHLIVFFERRNSFWYKN